MTKRTIYRGILLMLFTSAYCLASSSDTTLSSSHNQDEGEDSYTWLYCGLGPAVFSSRMGLAVGGGVVHQRGKHLFSIRLTQVREYEISFGGPTIPSPAEEVLGLAVLYGMSSRNGSTYNSVSIGLSISRSIRRGARIDPMLGADFEEIRRFSPGIPIDAQLIIQPISFLGLGIDLFCQINTRDSFGGLLLSLQVE